MVKIINVKPDSPAEKIGVLSGDFLVSIDDHNIDDFLDYQFYQAEEYLEVHIIRDGQDLYSPLEKEFDQDIGLTFEKPKINSCENNCIFCFINQNPKGMRRAIYFHDEDYRYSFLYGNFITLTNMTEKELNRIVNQRLSPLYISVHATDSKIRKEIFRYKNDDRMMEKIEFLSNNGIILHTQIVLIPGINDGEILEKTISDLFKFKENILSLSIVPVGLTKHRGRLSPLKSVDRIFSKEFIKNTERWNKNYKNIDDENFVNIADEFFVLAEEKLPDGEYYGQFHQIENGVGLTREFLDEFEYQQDEFPKSIPEEKKILLITGELAKPILKQYISPVLNGIDNLKVDIKAIRNFFYGPSVTVSGLLTGQDIINQVDNPEDYDLIVFPPRCTNTDGLFLDDLTPEDVGKQFNVPVIVNENFLEIINNVSR